jgi:hypothetical protein
MVGSAPCPWRPDARRPHRDLRRPYDGTDRGRCLPPPGRGVAARGHQLRQVPGGQPNQRGRGRGLAGEATEQLPVVAVVKPRPRSVIPLVVLAAELSWLVDRPDASAQRSVQRPSSGQAPSPCSTMPGRQPWPRSPVRVQHAVSTHPVPSSGARRSGPSGVRSVRCPVTWVRRPGSGVRPSGVHPSGVQPSGVHPPSVWSPSGGGVGGQADAARQPPSRELAQVLWAPRRRAARSTAEPARTRATPPRSPMAGGLSGADPGRVGCGRRPRLTPASRAGQAGMPSARRRRRRCGHGRRPQREVAAPAA